MFSDAYESFLTRKRRDWKGCGLSIESGALPDELYPFQARLTSWALRKGRAALFADTGLGKSRMQVAWADKIPGRVLILAPLCVAPQTIAEGRAIGVKVGALGSGERIEITNYERLHHVRPDEYSGVVLDESSILKAFDGKTRTRLIQSFAETPYRLCCTATPAPNDIAELANHCEFLGIMTRSEMLATFFVHDEDGWRLKGHASDAFYRWLASWGMFLRRPSDLGFNDDGYLLPPLNISDVVVRSGNVTSGEFLFHGMGLGGIRGRLAVRRDSLKPRVDATVKLVQGALGQWIVWCGLNDEQDAIASALGDDCVSVAGSDDADEKQGRIEAFICGDVRVLVSKPKIAGFGLNLQRCHQMVFLGLGDSYETYYQSIRRCYRFGQTSPVAVHCVVSEAETEIVANVRRKETEASHLASELIGHMAEAEREEIGMSVRQRETIMRDVARGQEWTLYRGDSVEVLPELPDDSVDLSVYSPPFIALYTYTNSERDIGNCSTQQEFFDHFGYVVRELLRVTKPGRLTCCHLSQVPAMKARDGYIGMKDMRGPTVALFEREGWIYQGEVVIDKDPQALRHGTRVLTATGWRPIEALAVGDDVIGGVGQRTKVLGVWPQGRRPLYRVTFSDGVSVECDGAHLWAVRAMGRKWQATPERQWGVMRTDAIYGRTHTSNGVARYEIPLLREPAMFDPVDLPLDPYVLGVLLGDGSLTVRGSIEFMAEPDVASRVAERLKNGCEVSARPYGVRRGVQRFAVTHPAWHVNPTLSALRVLGIVGRRAWEKAVPQSYHLADPSDRLELLRGLMDTDGTCKKNGMPYFATVSERLAHDVVELVQGLGGKATIHIEEAPAYGFKGTVRYGRTRYVVAVTSPSNPFSLPRKMERWHRARAITRRIVAVERSGEDECTCITVASDDGLFIIDHGLVTHNSQAIRVRAKGLAFQQLHKDASWMRPALADYIVLFRKSGDNAVPILPDITNEDWIEWARPIWYNIRESDTLNAAEARTDDDDRHVCPLQLGTIERCVRLWSNPGETVLSPFAGIGSEGYEALRLGRKFIGVELKREYFDAACKNLRRMEDSIKRQTSLF